MQTFLRGNNGEKKRILVVDDYVPTRRLIVDALSQCDRYEIGEAENGVEALGLFDSDRYDLVISDVVMPGMSGMELLNSIREISYDTSVIMITAHPALELGVSAIKKGAVDFIKKPIDIDELVYKVDIYLRERSLLKSGRGEEGHSVRWRDKTHELSVQSYIYDSIENADGDNDEIFQKVVDLSIKVVGGGSCSLLLYDEESGEFHPKIIHSEDEASYRKTTIPALHRFFEDVVVKKEALLLRSDDHPDISPSLICAPLMIRNKVFGVLSVRKARGVEVFTSKDLHYIVSLTKRASLNLENNVLYESMYGNLMDTFRSLVASIQVRDHYTEAHSLRVAQLAMSIADVLDLPEDERETLRVAAILHDVGKIAIPDSILLKPDRLTNEEYCVIKEHPSIGENIVRKVLLFNRVRDVVRHHHERWDGNGYPAGLAGDRIPYLARVLAVADSFDAMMNNRPYRDAIGRTKALEELVGCSGQQFDGTIVEAFLKVV
jgi:putative nucleotidyltransferase with HDIG domain